MKRAMLLAGAGLALVLAAAPLAAQDAPMAAEAEAAPEEQVDFASEGEPAEEFVFLTEEEEELAKLEEEMAATFGLMGALFEVDPLTPEQEARLPLAQDMARLIMPDGSFGAAMDSTMEPMMAMIIGEAGNDPRTRLAEISGVPAEELAALGDAEAQEALDIFDPQFAARQQRSKDLVVGMIGKLLDLVEPAYREALAGALAVRFDEGEMRELLAFFATPVGAKFAQESFLVQFDPRMIGVMQAMGPAFVKIMPEVMEEAGAIEAELGTARDFTELSAAERTRAARLLDKSASELDALVPEYTVEADEEDPVI